MNNVGSSVFYVIDDDKRLAVSDRTAGTTDALADSTVDSTMSTKPGQVPKRPIPLPRGAVIPSQSGPCEVIEGEPTRVAVSPRKPSHLNGTRDETGDDWKYMTLPTKGSPKGKRARRASDDTSLNGRNNERHVVRTKPPLPTKPAVLSTVRPVSPLVKCVTSPVLPCEKAGDKPLSMAESSKRPVPDKPLGLPVGNKPVLPLKPTHVMNGKATTPVGNVKPEVKNLPSIEPFLRKPRRKERMERSQSVTCHPDDVAVDVAADAVSRRLSGEEFAFSHKPVPAPRLNQKAGTVPDLRQECEAQTACKRRRETEGDSPTSGSLYPLERPVPPPRNQDSSQKVHNLALKLSLLPLAQEPGKLSMPEMKNHVMVQGQNGLMKQHVKYSSQGHLNNDQLSQSVSDSLVMTDPSAKPNTPTRSTTFSGRVPSVRKQHKPVKKTESADVLSRAASSPADSGDGRRKKHSLLEKSSGFFGAKTKGEKKISASADSRGGSDSSDIDDGVSLKPSPSLRRRVNAAFGAFKRKFGGGKKETEVEEVEEEMCEEDPDDELLPKLSVIPKLRHVSMSLKRARSNSGVSDGDEDKGQLFQYVRVVSLEPDGNSSKFKAVVTYRFPPAIASHMSREEQQTLELVPAFCFPDLDQWKPVTSYKSETYSFVLTDIEGEKRFGYCRRLLPSGSGPRLPEVYCIISPHGCFELYSKILDAVEQRRSHSASAVFTFLQAVIANPFPSPGRAVKVKALTFGSGTDEMEELVLRRPLDSDRLEHVKFETLFTKLGVARVLSLFAAMLMERHIIFSASKLSTLSECVHAAAALLYPFSWQHVYIPVLPNSLMDFCCAPSPYIMGVLSSSLGMLEMDMVEADVLIVDFDKGKFVKQVGDEDDILPPKLRSALTMAIDSSSQFAGSDVIVEAFVRFFVETIGHYHQYLASNESEEFRMDAFVKAPKSKGIKKFLSYFKNTQMLQTFVDQRIDAQFREALHNSLFEKRVRECGAETLKFGKGKSKGIGGKLKGLSHTSFSKVISKAKEGGVRIKKRLQGVDVDEQGSEDD